jgi:predicted transcriptional regulator
MKRSRLEMYLSILKACKISGGSGLTKLCYMTNISSTKVTDLMQVLIAKELIVISVNGKRRVFRATPKGVALVNKFDQIEALIPIKDQVSDIQSYLDEIRKLREG